MITLHQTIEPSRFDVSLCEKFPDDNNAPIEGHVIRHPDGQWQAFINGELVGEHENPTEAAKLAVNDYPLRARRVVERAIIRIEGNIRDTSSPMVRAAKERMLVSLRTALRDGTF